MIKVYAKLSCGCCTEELEFNDIQSAQEAFSGAGLTSTGKITDDAGVEHNNIDTFYGFTMSDDELQNRGIGYLVKMLL